MIYEIEFLGHYNVILNSGVGGAFKLLIVWYTDFWKHKQKQVPKCQPQSILLYTKDPKYNVVHI